MNIDLTRHVDAALSVSLDDSLFDSAEGSIDREILRNPYQYLQSLRQQHGAVVPLQDGRLGEIDFAGLWHQERSKPSFAVLGYDAVRECFDAHDRFRQAHHGEPVFGDVPMFSDPPISTPYKAVVMKALGRSRVEQLDREVVRPACELLAARMAERGRGNLVQDYTGILPFIVISALFDLPAEWSAKFIKQARDIVVMGSDPDAAYVAIGQQRHYFTTLLYERRKNPGDDLLSWFGAAKLPGGETLKVSEIVGFCLMLVPAGTETTTRALGQLMVALLSNQDQLQRLIDDRSLVPGAVAEALRWDAPVPIIPKAARIDTELEGVGIPQDAIVYCCNGEANRDPRIWNDPHDFQIDRKSEPNMSFGGGAHFCAGHVLARQELETGLSTILEYLPGIRLDEEAGDPEILGLSFRSAANIPYIV